VWFIAVTSVISNSSQTSSPKRSSSHRFHLIPATQSASRTVHIDHRRLDGEIGRLTRSSGRVLGRQRGERPSRFTRRVLTSRGVAYCVTLGEYCIATGVVDEAVTVAGTTTMKRIKRFGLLWSQLSEKELADMAPRMFAFMLLAPLILWGLIRLFNWLASHLINDQARFTVHDRGLIRCRGRLSAGGLERRRHAIWEQARPQSRVYPPAERSRQRCPR
jgi:hypothetical protein